MHEFGTTNYHSVYILDSGWVSDSLGYQSPHKTLFAQVERENFERAA